MPKFLDTPSWYNSSGTETIGRGEIVIRNMAGATYDLFHDFPDDCNIFIDISSASSINFLVGSSSTPIVQVSTFPTSPPILIKKRRKTNNIYEGVFYEFVNLAISTVTQANNTIYCSISAGRSFCLHSTTSGANSVTAWTYYSTNISLVNGSPYYNSNIYTPTSPGTSGQILMSNGTGAPKWGNLKAHILSMYCTQANYSVNCCISWIDDDTYSNGPTAMAALTSKLHKAGIDSYDNVYPASGIFKGTGTVWGPMLGVYGTSNYSNGVLGFSGFNSNSSSIPSGFTLPATGGPPCTLTYQEFNV